MKRNIVLWQFVGFVAVSFFGVLLHFLYDWTNITFTALFSAVNESTWEHMKLIFFPMFFFSLIQSAFIGKEYENFWCIKLRGIIIGLVLVPVMFYTIRGVAGPTPDWVNIAIFFVAVLIAFIYETKQFLKDTAMCKSSFSAFIVLCLIAVLFIIFTFIPPQIPLFQDPIAGGFGIE